jgi:hypothetical protein
MFVFIDKNNGYCRMFDVGRSGHNHEIPFRNIESIHNYIEPGEEILYITGLTKTSSNNIVELVKSVLKSEENISGDGYYPENIVSNMGGSQSPQDDNQTKYLCSKNEGSCCIPGAHIPGEDIVFESRYDYKIIDNPLQELIDNSIFLQTLLTNGNLKIINENQKRELMIEKKSDLNKKAEKQKAKDKKLSGIIMDGKVDDWDGKMADDSDRDDPVSINLDIE